MQRATINAISDEFSAIRNGAERAISQLDSVGIRARIDPATNSVAIIMKHVAGNLRSRFTDFLTTDGEKPWRQRDREFVDDWPPGDAGRAAVWLAWTNAWQLLSDALAELQDEDLSRIVHIRGEPHTVMRALVRSLAHAAYHHAQIVLVARTIVGPERWKTLSIPINGSDAFNRSLGYEPGLSGDQGCHQESSE